MGFIGVPAFFVLILGLVALSRGRLTWARIHNRRTAGIVTGVAGVVLATAVALDPPPPAPVAAPVTTTPPAPTVSSAATPAPRSTTNPSTTTPDRTTTVAPATTSTSMVPPTTTTTTPPALPPLASADRVLCRVDEGSGAVYVSITSAVQHNFDACAGGQRLPEQDLQSAVLAGGSTVDRRCVSSNDDVRRDDAIIGVYASSRSVDIAAARTFCTAHSILGN